MTNSKHIAKLIGPALIVMSISEMMNADIWANVSPTQTYLAGMLWFVAGLSIIRIHPKWTLGWPVLITFIGWFAMLGGIGRMFFPNPAQEGAQNPALVIAIQLTLIVIGIVLSFNAYRSKDTTPPPQQG